MNAEENKDKKPIRGGRNLVLLGVGAITIALITTSISLYFYSKGDIYIDRSRPGYISEDEVRQADDDYQEKYSDEGDITDDSLAEYLEELDRVTERIESSQNDFGPDPLSDDSLMITPDDD
jgi:hypothetical protein